MSYFTRFPRQAAIDRAKGGHTPNTGHDNEEDEKGKKKKPFGGRQAKPFGKSSTLKFVS